MMNKTIFKFLGGGAVLVLLGAAALYAPGVWQKYQVDKAIVELERPYREDIYGGKTPEETFDMFLGALKKDDTDLASKYFVVRKQAEYKEKFEKMSEEGALNGQIQEWERARKEWTKVVDEYNNWKTRAATKYPYEQKESETVQVPIGGGKFDTLTIPAGIYYAETIFDLNELTKVWKITQL